MHADQQSDLLRPGDVARIFNVAPSTVRMWARLGKLAEVRTPGGQRRFRRADVEALVGKASA
ncbi:helix-turn-helix domain-containing protein [uncultured Jatrophihabitans sp.]|uniref:helix-turn-helix domain-containing protein n=1 Tax=uncultured Jatrophihabitans sp. TaxID=1610747 RepID=UPI0035CBB8F8